MKRISLPQSFVRAMIVLASLGSTLSTWTTAQAADTETGQSAKHDWEGLYVGIAGDLSKSGVDISGIGKKGDLDIESKKSRISGAVIAGYNFTSGPWVFGAEGNLGTLGLEEVKAVTGLGNVKSEADWAASISLRGGYAFDNLLLFGTAGIAIADLETSSSLGGKFDKVVPGAVFGVGAEYAFTDSLSARAELLGYAFRGEATLNGSKRDVDLGHGVVRLGMTYKF
jgi:outer membrane immunogenic protein